MSRVSGRAASVFRALALLLGIGLSAGFAEIAIRVVAPHPVTWPDFFRRHPELPFFGLQPGVRVLIDNGDRRWAVYTDANGFRTGRDPVPQAGRPMALVLGDSYTFGVGVDHEMTFVSLIEEALDHRYRFVNGGVSGYGPEQYRRVLEYLLEQGYQPELLVIAVFLGNDLHDCIWDKDVPVVDGIPGGELSLRSWLKRNLHLYRLLSNAYHRFMPNARLTWQTGKELYRDAAWRNGELARAATAFRAEMGRIAALARARSLPLVVAIIPTAEAVAAAAGALVEEDSAAGPEFGLPARRVTRVLGELGIPHVDLTPSLAQHGAAESYFPRDRHLTPLGHRIAAQAITRRIAGLPGVPSGS